MSYYYNVEKDRNGSEFRALINQIRHDLRNSTWTQSRIPVLEPQDGAARNAFTIRLETSQYQITLRIRRDNVYLEGYQQGTDDWYEFRPDGGSQQMINGSIPLDYGGSYSQLETAESGHNTRSQASTSDGRTGRLRIPLGHQALINAVNVLGRGPQQQKNKGPESQRARQLLVLIQMISEAIRFTEISDDLITNWRSETPATPRFVNLQTSWGTISEAILRLGQNAAFSAVLPSLEGNSLGITTVVEAARILAILLVPKGGDKPGTSGKRTGRGAPPSPFLGTKGRALVEVFWLRIDNIDNENPGDLFGNATAFDGIGNQAIILRDRGNYESVTPGKYATMRALGRSIGAADPFEIRFDLKDRDDDLIGSDDDISQGSLWWNTYDASKLYDQTTSYQVRGAYGAATLNYVVLSSAAQANIEIILRDGDGENPADIYGEITANNGHGVIDLFRKQPRSSYIKLRPGDRVPLLRSIMAVPMSGELMIEAQLTDYDLVPLDRDDEVANNTAVFKPQFQQSAAKPIKGQNGWIEVRVEWS
ncbi:ribosome-inactivating protein [Xylariaceae sp. FL0255]|nr:ribosome-inactivating protein [Xylariaceae sp. FL0255]